MCMAAGGQKVDGGGGGGQSAEGSQGLRFIQGLEDRAFATTIDTSFVPRPLLE